MNFFANQFLRLRPMPAARRLFQMPNLKVIWTAVALTVTTLSCTSTPESSNSALETPATTDNQAKAAAALAAADATGATNEMLPAATPPQTVASADATGGMLAPATPPQSIASAGAPDEMPPPATPPQTVAPASASTNTDEVSTNVDEVATNADDVLTNGMEALDDTYKLAVGDTITFQITEDEDEPQSIAVEDSGDVEIPYVGRYPATGKTCKELARQLKKQLEKKYYYQATVIVSVDTMITHGVVYVIGGVKAPGPMEMPKDDVLTVSKAILRAGGFDDFADEKRVRVTRKTDGGTNEVITVNVSQVLDKGQTWNDVNAKPGDLIYVPEKTVRF